ncbi:amino acid ABC transporter ATP-binding protein [Pontiella sulfatireligans]|uniref:Arginine transport ATP-binding protein ArtM n=1 Tax=Pontiella sulfatireligans TaxID=2750658 RepID=A0A6C2ULH2_9BACT|nr:ATP-binding cassette domain-containing protein [Pontiella sulfatireligans]VGO20753.1 Arginine transport ATP-binding protein ArtM [Pontiella sulfatireligans]
MADSEIDPILTVRGLDLRFNDTEVLRDLSLDLNNRERLAVIGRSGVGKSCLLRCLATLEQPSSGDMRLLDSYYCKGGLFTEPPHLIRQQIGLVFQHFNLFPNMTVLRNITLPLERVIKSSRSVAIKKAERAAEALGISDILNKYPNSISGGQAQRVALCRALVLRPKVLLLDEVTSAVDPETSLEMVKAIDDLWKFEIGDKSEGNEPFGLIVVTHDYSFAKSFADRIAFLAGGKVVEDHQSDAFDRNIQHPHAIRYLNAIQSKALRQRQSSTEKGSVSRI